MSAPTLRDAEAAIRRLRKAQRARYEATLDAATLREQDALAKSLGLSTRITLRYDRTKVIETARWWYIPHCWIGCLGFIVDKRHLAVNWLGSGIPLEDALWGHDRGLFADPVDFTFTADLKPHWETVWSIVERFQRPVPQPDPLGKEHDFYPAEEVRPAILAQFPTFRAHLVWFAIPRLRAAVAAGAVSFHAERVQGPESA